jgi:hypothetical protein
MLANTLDHGQGFCTFLFNQQNDLKSEVIIQFSIDRLGYSPN